MNTFRTQVPRLPGRFNEPEALAWRAAERANFARSVAASGDALPRHLQRCTAEVVPSGEKCANQACCACIRFSTGSANTTRWA